MPKKNLAKQIASKSLRACYTKDGIIAGTHHFTDYWARDAFFAAFGSIAIGDTKIVKKLLSLFFSYQRADGLIPYRIMRGPLSLSKYFGHPKFYVSPKPTYNLRGIGQSILDGTTLSVLFASLLQETTYLPQIKKALIYLESKEKNGLLWDGPMAEWNDAVWKYGNLLYSNVIYWYMYDQLTSWTKRVDPIFSQKLSQKSNDIAQNLRNRLWTGKYFADWHDYKRQDYFYPFGNCLAIAWGLTTKKESELILKECQKNEVAFTLETNTPKYPWWRVDIMQRIIGMSDYQNHGILWWQPVTAYLSALKKTGHIKEAINTENKMIDKIVSYQEIYETYERNGSPTKRTIYSSEHPFSWSAGLILWSLAYNNPNGKK